MNEAITTMVKHPFATMLIISTTGYAIADIIRAAKGVKPVPACQFDISTRSKKT